MAKHPAFSNPRSVLALAAGALALAYWTADPVPAGAQQAAAESDRGRIFAPWDPARIAERRKEYGLIGPGSSKPIRRRAFPSRCAPRTRLTT